MDAHQTPTSTVFNLNVVSTFIGGENIDDDNVVVDVDDDDDCYLLYYRYESTKMLSIFKTIFFIYSLLGIY